MSAPPLRYPLSVRRPPRSPLLLLAAIAAFLAPSCRTRSAGVEAGGPIVLVSIDTLRADRLPAYGYRAGSTPALDALAADAILFENAYAHYPLTLPSHASMLTGRLPTRHGVRDNVGYRLDGERFPPLAARLAARGYATGGFVSSFVLDPATGIAAGFGAYDSPRGPRPGGALEAAQRGADDTLAGALPWLRAHAERPFFLFFHLYEPHAPYTPPEPFRSRFPDPYDGEVAAADAAVGALVAELVRLGLYDRTTVVVVSDHGEGLGDHGEHRHGVFLYRSTLQVPLLFKLPQSARAGTRVARPVGLVDLAPTLARLARLEPGAPSDGRDLLADAAPQDARALYAETFYPRLHFGWSDLQALVEERWYFIQGPEPELFDLVADPRQQRNVLAEERRERARLARALEAELVPLEPPGSVDDETARQLAALGYLSAGSRVDELDLPDPKSQRHLLGPLQEGIDAHFDGRFADAVAPLSTVLAENPGMVDGWSMLARSLDQLGRTEEAIAAWERVLDLSGGSPSTALVVAERAFALGRLERAQELVESVATAESEDALDLAIRIDLAAGRAERAHRRMTEALALGTASQQVRRHLALAELAAGRAAEALALLEGAGDDLEAPTRILRSLAMAEAGRAAAAELELARARDESASPADFFADLGEALFALGRSDRAREAFQEAVRLEPTRADAWSALGVARLAGKDPTGALEAWSRAVELDPGQLDAWYNLGVVAARQGDRALARRAFRTFLDRAPAATPAEQRRRAETELARLGAG